MSHGNIYCPVNIAQLDRLAAEAEREAARFHPSDSARCELQSRAETYRQAIALELENRRKAGV